MHLTICQVRTSCFDIW